MIKIAKENKEKTGPLFALNDKINEIIYLGLKYGKTIQVLDYRFDEKENINFQHISQVFPLSCNGISSVALSPLKGLRALKEEIARFNYFN